MATLKQQTDALLNSFASFIIAATGLPVYLYGREFTRPAGQYITLNVLSILENGTPANEWYDLEGFYSSVMNYDIRITAVCYRDNAYVPLMTLKQRIQSNSNMYDTYFPDADFGYLNSTQILRFDAPIDSVTFEERASCTFDFNLSVVEIEPDSSGIIETVNITTSVYDPNKQSEDYVLSISNPVVNTPYQAIGSSNKLFELINDDMKRFGSSTWIPDNGEFEVIIDSANTLYNHINNSMKVGANSDWVPDEL